MSRRDPAKVIRQTQTKHLKDYRNILNRERRPMNANERGIGNRMAENIISAAREIVLYSFWGKWNNRKDQETAAAEVGPAGTGKHFCISKGGQLHHIFVGKKLVGTV